MDKVYNVLFLCTGNSARSILAEAAFVSTYMILKRRIDLFTVLPVHSIDKLALQKRVQEIGKE